MSTRETLPEELIWLANGHLSEVALTCAADGEEAILGSGALTHLECCTECMSQLGHAALFSAELGQVLREAQLAPSPRAFPVWAVALAVTIAAISSSPVLIRAGSEFARILRVVQHAIPALLQSLAIVLRSLGGFSWVISLCCAAVLFLIGISVARTVPRSVVS